MRIELPEGTVIKKNGKPFVVPKTATLECHEGNCNFVLADPIEAAAIEEKDREALKAMEAVATLTEFIKRVQRNNATFHWID